MFADGVPVGRDLDDGVVLYAVVALHHLAKSALDLGGEHVGQEAEPPGVDADDGYALCAHPAGSLQKRAVASDGNGKVGLEVVAVEKLVGGHIEMERVSKVVMESAVYGNLRVVGGKECEDIADGCQLIVLKFLSEKGETQFSFYHK